ncbi:FAD-dependent oxidoreductase [Thioclava sp. A2]|uniref:NAD(P)/FAD-dependent oxidoreductase n=1 Tax=Thioclava sp. FCG-A2 TaxID=3080562 RepID=UPI002952ACFB|nr:FAD-dependent oxidoreductase [Thioclava sp. A2]MDV7271006.1 FAD-dependent oxidoreductase [Thioclava sp. A2]
MRQKLVIVGAGMAAGRLLDRLSAAPARYDITLVNAEPRGSYNRIMLSPVLAGDKAFADIVTHDEAWYRAQGITCQFGQRVDTLDRDGKLVTLSDGTALPYDRLVLATGSMPFMPPLPGIGLAGVISYRDLEDTRTMMDLRAGQRAVVLGGGLLGLEAAAGMAARGIKVSVVHLNTHLMERQLDAEASALLRTELEARGINIHCGAQSQSIVGSDGRVQALRLEDGRDLPCDLLVIATGIRPSVALAQSAGLTTARGVTVDDRMTTSDPAILAIGECTEHRGQTFGLVAPVFDQADVAARILAGQEATFTPREISAKLKVTGCDLFSAGDFDGGRDTETIVLRDPARSRYRRLVLRDNRIIGIVLYGDTSDGPWFFDLMKARADVSLMRDALIFGQAYAAASRHGMAA